MKTSKGTVLEFQDLKGKQYLPVQQRLLWFRDDNPDWRIETECVEANDQQARFVARIRDEDGDLIATGHGSETMKDFRDFYEKAETKAIGRALAHAGFGTQFALEMDEGTRIVDSPVAPRRSKVQQQRAMITNQRSRILLDACETYDVDAKIIAQYMKDNHSAQRPDQLTEDQFKDVLEQVKYKSGAQ